MIRMDHLRSSWATFAVDDASAFLIRLVTATEVILLCKFTKTVPASRHWTAACPCPVTALAITFLPFFQLRQRETIDDIFFFHPSPTSGGDTKMHHWKMFGMMGIGIDR